MSKDEYRPYPEGFAWDEAWRQRQRAEKLEAAIRQVLGGVFCSLTPLISIAELEAIAKECREKMMEESMSNFNCEHCGAPCIDSPRGYVTGCEHYPADVAYSDIFEGRIPCDGCGQAVADCECGLTGREGE